MFRSNLIEMYQYTQYVDHNSGHDDGLGSEDQATRDQFPPLSLQSLAKL